MLIPPTVLRERGDDGAAPPVTSIELFFDLVYVFAVTQLSHQLLEHLTLRGGLQTLVLLMAVWWAWNYTAWATNWIDPDRPQVRMLMIALMLISLIMSASIPEAFGDKGLEFAAAYVTLQLLRSAFMVAAFRGQRMGRNYAQLLAWSAIAGVFWIAGAFADGDARMALWIIALVLDYGAPIHGFTLPGLGGTPISDWTLAGGHLAERCQLVILIALGESVLATGLTFSELDHTTAAIVAAFVVGFLNSVSLWLIYFVGHAEQATRAIAASSDPARLGRAGYAYGHAVMVGGIIVTAVATDLTIDHPGADMTRATAAVILGGPAIYLAGNALFNTTVLALSPRSRLVAIAILALLAFPAAALTPLALFAAATLVTLALGLRGGTPRRLLVGAQPG